MQTKVTIEVPPSSVDLSTKSELKVLCIDITPFSQLSQFVICCCLVFIFYLAYGYLQELIFTLEGFKPFGWYLTLVQFFYYSLFGLVESKLKESGPRRIPLSTYLLLAVLTLGTMGFSNASLGYLNYPTQVIFKCCKLVPVLIGSVLIQGKKYNMLDYIAAVCMCVGLTFFILADSQTTPNFDTLGVFMISIALLCDAMIGNIQEKAMKTYNASNNEVVLYSYFFGLQYLFVILFISGNLSSGFNFCAEHPVQTYGYGLLFSLVGYAGIQAVLCLVKTTGAPMAATVTTARKGVTIIFSFLLFSKPFVFQYLWSGLIVLLGIYLNVLSKQHPNFSVQYLISFAKSLQFWKKSHKHFSAVV